MKRRPLHQRASLKLASHSFRYHNLSSKGCKTAINFHHNIMMTALNLARPSLRGEVHWDGVLADVDEARVDHLAVDLHHRHVVRGSAHRLCEWREERENSVRDVFSYCTHYIISFKCGEEGLSAVGCII